MLNRRIIYKQFEKNKWIDAAKGVLILLVVVGHNIQFGSGAFILETKVYFNNAVFQFIYAFHIPAFALLAGYVMKFSVGKDHFISTRFRLSLHGLWKWDLMK